jgi:hypothetical protein
MLHDSGEAPGRLVVADNVITQDTASSGIAIDSAQHVTISNNDLTWTVPAPSGAGIEMHPVLRPADGIMISGNRINAPGLLAAVYLRAPDVSRRIRRRQYGARLDGKPAVRQPLSLRAADRARVEQLGNPAGMHCATRCVPPYDELGLFIASARV